MDGPDGRGLDTKFGIRDRRASIERRHSHRRVQPVARAPSKSTFTVSEAFLEQVRLSEGATRPVVGRPCMEYIGEHVGVVTGIDTDIANAMNAVAGPLPVA